MVDKPWEGWDLRLELTSTERSGDVVATLTNAVVRRDDFVLGPLNVRVAWADRVAIVGPNGVGKTTLLEALLGRIPLESGEAHLGRSVTIGELNQARDLFADDRSLLDGFIAASETLIADARSLLAKFGLGTDDVNRPADELSPANELGPRWPC